MKKRDEKPFYKDEERNRKNNFYSRRRKRV